MKNLIEIQEKVSKMLGIEEKQVSIWQGHLSHSFWCRVIIEGTEEVFFSKNIEGIEARIEDYIAKLDYPRQMALKARLEGVEFEVEFEYSFDYWQDELFIHSVSWNGQDATKLLANYSPIYNDALLANSSNMSKLFKVHFLVQGDKVLFWGEDVTKYLEQDELEEIFEKAYQYAHNC
ncbi:MAG: hypothetical protein OHK0045_22680 [Raineya sp.]